MTRDGPKKGPDPAGGDGSRAISERDCHTTVAPRRDVGNIQSQDPHIWPKDDHPFARELRLNRDYVWGRMMASVCPGEAL